MGLLLAALAAFGIDETLPVERRRPATISSTARSYVTLSLDRVFIALALIGGLMMGGIFAYVAGATFVLQDGFGLDAQEFGLVFGVISVGLTLTCQVNPIMLRYFSVRQVLGGAIVAEFLSAVALLTVSLTRWGGVLAVITCMGLVVCAAILSLPNTPALALSRHGARAGTAAAVLGFVQFGIGGLVAPLVGAFGSSTAAPMAAVMMCVTGLAALLMIGIVRRELASTAVAESLPAGVQPVPDAAP